MDRLIPLSIWNEEAYVRLSPTYIVDVANMSSIAGGKKMRGLKLQTGLSTTAASSLDWDYHKLNEKWMSKELLQVFDK